MSNIFDITDGKPIGVAPYSGASLKSEGGGGTFDHMSAISREELDAKLNATEARIDASLARMEGKLEHLPTTANLWIAAASAVVAVVGITATFLTLGADRFNGGFEIGSAQIGKALGVDKIAADNAQQSKDIQALTSSVKTLSTKLDDILTEVKAFKTSQPPNQQK